MNREVQVRFCERFGGASPPYLLDLFLNSIYFQIKSIVPVPVKISIQIYTCFFFGGKL